MKQLSLQFGLFVLLASLPACVTSLPPMQTSTGNAGGQSGLDVNGVLQNATGKYCTSLWCPDLGNPYQISGIQLSPDRQNIVMIYVSGAPSASLPVQSLAPHASDAMGQGVLFFTSDFEPQLVTTDVEAQRLVVALNAIKNGTASSQAGNVASSAPPAPPAPVAPPPVSVAAAPPPVPAAASAAAAGDMAGKRLAIVMAQQCPSDPDPIGFVEQSQYSDCDPAELDKVKSWITDALNSQHVFAEIGDTAPDLTLTVTMTQDMDDRTTGLAILSDFAPGTLKFQATYQLADQAGHAITGGTVSHQESDSDDAVAAEQTFAGKVAAAVAGTPAGNAPPITTGSPGAGAKP